MKTLRKVCMIVLAVFLALVSFLSALALSLLIAEDVCESYARILPSYAKTDITGTLGKEEWTEEDYALLYRQTGLAPEPLNALKSNPEKILEFQDALFYEGVLGHLDAAITTPHDYLEGYFAPIAPLKDGDVLVTSSCHTYGWRNGHAAIIVNAQKGLLLESVAPGILSGVSDLAWFRHSSNFIVLRMKDLTDAQRTEIAASALEHLHYIPYSLTVGVFSAKDQGLTPEATHCAHLVWQAYKNFGYDIDCDGGNIVTAHDIAVSPLFEVVQVYGFDVEKLW